MKRCITLGLLTAALMAVIAEDSQAQSRGRRGRSAGIQRSGGLTRNRSVTPSVGRRTRLQPRNTSGSLRRPVKQTSRRPRLDLTRPRPNPSAGGGLLKPRDPKTNPLTGITRPRPFPKPDTGGSTDSPRQASAADCRCSGARAPFARARRPCCGCGRPWAAHSPS